MVATAGTVGAILVLVSAGLGVFVMVWPSEKAAPVPGAKLVPLRSLPGIPITASHRAGDLDPLVAFAIAALRAGSR